jgi:hypothetical protein
MIKFFRNIRQRLVAENKLNKYLLYAIGEIVLVVIGILIALQINNWNQERLDRIRSIEFHQRLADELAVMEERSNDDVRRAKQLVEYLRQSVLILSNGELSETARDTLDYTLQNFFQFVRLEGELKAFEEMKSTGQLGLIYNKELKENLLEYMSYLESISKVYDQLAEKVNDTEMVDKYVKINIKKETTQSTLEYDFQQMAKDHYLINKFSRYGYYWQTKQQFSEWLGKMSGNLRDNILEEIEKYDH